MSQIPSTLQIRPDSATLAEMWDALPDRPALSDYDFRQMLRDQRAAAAAAYVSPDMAIRQAARARRIAKREAA